MVGTGRFQKQMILSKAALRKGFFNITDKRNRAIHEFVHLMDKMDGETDGIPEGLLEKQFIIPW
ncbi:MAG: Mlc titration factor MtfA (ptsG expression regulator), partial [Urechidicola sp.]